VVEPGSSPGLHEHRRGDSHGTLGRHAVDLHVREGGRRLNVRTSLACAVACASLVLIATGRAVAADAGAAPPVLQAVVVVSRHGVRSPMKLGELDAYAAQPWPAWPVGPGELTPHGAMLMTAFGRAYRESFAAAGLGGAGCPPAGSAYVWADVDERTRATGEALATGFAPGCALRVDSSRAGVDPLFHSIPTIAAADPALERAMLEGSIGGSPAAVVEAAGPAFSVLEEVLGCDRRPATCRSIAGKPSSIVVSPKSGVASLGGSVALAATAAEDLILEYSEGQALVGWGRVDRAKLLELSRLHGLKERFENETPYAARIGASNLLMHVRATIDQAASGVRDAGTRAPVGARSSRSSATTRISRRSPGRCGSRGFYRAFSRTRRRRAARSSSRSGALSAAARRSCAPRSSRSRSIRCAMRPRRPTRARGRARAGRDPGLPVAGLSARELRCDRGCERRSALRRAVVSASARREP